MSTTVRALIHVPRQVRRGDVVEIRAMIAHPMETGHRPDAEGAPRAARHRHAASSAGLTPRRSSPPTLYPAVAANPYFAFALRAERSGTLVLTWEGDNGFAQTRDGRARGDMTRWAGAAAAAALLAVALAACTLAGSAPSLRTATSVGADTRRSGFDDMSPALQAMQRDDTQNPGMLWVQRRRGAVGAARPQRQQLRQLPWRRRRQRGERGGALSGVRRREAAAADARGPHRSLPAAPPRPARRRRRRRRGARAFGVACAPRARPADRATRRRAARAMARARRGALATAHRPARPRMHALPRRARRRAPRRRRHPAGSSDRLSDRTGSSGSRWARCSGACAAA